MSSPEATHANHLAPQESAEDQTTRDIYGPKCSEPLAFYDPESRSWRMFGVITLWDLTVSLETLPTSGMTASGRLFRRSPWVRHIAESGSSAWPTPVSSSSMAEDLDMVLERLESGRPYKSRLVEAVAMWPTPRSNPAMASLITSEIANDPRRFPNLETVVGQRMEVGDGGRLNPMWVEWLMGFPLGWTDLED